MSKIIVIHTCGDCFDYNDKLNWCNKSDKRVGYGYGAPETIPDWCELEDYCNQEELSAAISRLEETMKRLKKRISNLSCYEVNA